MIASQLHGYCDVINKRLWHHQQKVHQASEARRRSVKIVVLSSFLSSLCRVRNKIMYALSWRTIAALIRVLFWCLFPPLLRNSGNKHQNSPLVSPETVRHSSAYIILYSFIHVTCLFISIQLFHCHSGKHTHYIVSSTATHNKTQQRVNSVNSGHVELFERLRMMCSYFVPYLGFCSTDGHQLYIGATLQVPYPMLTIPCLWTLWRI